MYLLVLSACIEAVDLPSNSSKPDGDTDTGESADTASSDDTGDSAVDPNPLPTSCVASSWAWGETLTVDDADASFVGEHAGSWTGGWLTVPGDLDGDGAGDLLVGAPFFTGSMREQGKVYVVAGAGKRQRSQAVGDWPGVVGTETDAEFSQTVAPGDLDGDGLADFVIHPGYQSTNVEEQFVFHGRETGWSDVATVDDADATIADASPECSGCVLLNDEWLGDVDGDGASDWLLTTQHDYNGQALVVPGTAVGAVAMPDDALRWLTAGERDTSFRGIGDVDGDGLGDIGAIAEDGTVRIVLGSSAPTAGMTAEDAADIVIASSGSVFAPASDLDGDGVDDVVLLDRDGVHLFLGRAGWPERLGPADADLVVVSGEDIADAAPVGDVNGDGIADLGILAASPASDGVNREAYLLLGRVAWPSEVALAEADVHFSMPDGSEEQLRLPTPDMLGDVNGDGIGDLLLRIPYESLMDVRAGVAYVYTGRTEWPSELASTDADMSMVGSVRSQSLGEPNWMAVGDLDGDGCDDIVSSSYYHPVTTGDATGEVFVFHGQYGP